MMPRQGRGGGRQKEFLEGGGGSAGVSGCRGKGRRLDQSPGGLVAGDSSGFDRAGLVKLDQEGLTSEWV